MQFELIFAMYCISYWIERIDAKYLILSFIYFFKCLLCLPFREFFSGQIFSVLLVQTLLPYALFKVIIHVHM